MSQKRNTFPLKSCVEHFGLCQLQGDSESTSGTAKRMAQQIQKDDLPHQQVLAAIVEPDTCTVNDGKLTSCATAWAKHFRDDINSLK